MSNVGTMVYVYAVAINNTNIVSFIYIIRFSFIEILIKKYWWLHHSFNNHSSVNVILGYPNAINLLYLAFIITV
jgi:hypothetical protein